MPAKPNQQNPRVVLLPGKPLERAWVKEFDTNFYLADLLKDYHLTTAISDLWPQLEKIILATQRETANPATCEAVSLLLHNLQMFAKQGDLDKEYIKKLPQ